MKHLYTTDSQGCCSVSNQGIIELAYMNQLQGAMFEWQDAQALTQFSQVSERLDHWPFEPRAPDVQDRTWFTPPEYQCINLSDHVLSRCTTQEQLERAQWELRMIQELDAEHIFLHLIYLVDEWRKHDLVWGIGRGSSVSCFVLYVIGINKINPLDYDLDPREFFKLSDHS